MTTEKEIHNSIQDLETRVGIPEGFLEQLRQEDDWSFVIKAHALMEATLTHWLLSELQRSELGDYLARLDTSDSKKGKLGFLNSLGLLEGYDKRFITSFSELRNRLVHDVSNTHFSFTEYISSMDKNQKESFCKCFGYAYLDEDKNGKELLIHKEIILKEPKNSLWHSLKIFLAIASLSMSANDSIHECRELELRTAKYYREINDLQG
jgi:hypothetical protein